MTLLMILLISGVVLLLLALPFLTRHPLRSVFGEPTFKHGSRCRELREEKASLLLALRELDFDYETGKLSASDYKAIREKYETKTIEVLKALEDAMSERALLQKEIDDRIAKTLGTTPSAAVGGTTPSPDSTRCPKCASSVRTGDKFCGNCGTRMQQSCPKCGAPSKPGDRFCASCGGQRLSVAHG